MKTGEYACRLIPKISLPSRHISPLFPRSALLSSQETKKHYSTLDRSSAFRIGFAFSFDHPGWAKGNFLVFRFLGQKEDFIPGISPANFQFPEDNRHIPNLQREINVFL